MLKENIMKPKPTAAPAIAPPKPQIQIEEQTHQEEEKPPAKRGKNFFERKRFMNYGDVDNKEEEESDQDQKNTGGLNVPVQ